MIDVPVLTKDLHGNSAWRLNGEYHRLDGPVIELLNGTKCWYINGKCHRVNGPAREYADGARDWYTNGKLHRIDGPAVEYPDGRVEWYLNGIILDPEIYLKEGKYDYPELIQAMIVYLVHKA